MTSSILNPAYREHVMLLYKTDEERNDAAADYINEGLKTGHLCLYASVGAHDTSSKWHYSNLSSKIMNFEEHVRQGDLLITDFKPFFEFGRKGDRTLFDQFKSQIEMILKQRIADGKQGKILAFADAACTLSESREFEECIQLEGWWHAAHEEWSKSVQNITVVCPHPATVFNEETTAHAKAQIASLHSLTLHARTYRNQISPVSRPIRILVAEPEPDIQNIYRRYLDSRGLEIEIVSTGGGCLESAFDTQDSEGFDMMLIDTHLGDVSGIEVAQKIRQRLPDQRIVITSTAELAHKVREIGINSEDILQKPFSFSRLLGLVKRQKSIS